MQEKNEKQEKDFQPPLQKERDGLSIDQIEGNRQGWSLDDIADQATQMSPDEIQRQAHRGDESSGDADARDTAGGPPSNETSQGREEAKNDVQGKANANG
jgi:hypothetical protein